MTGASRKESSEALARIERCFCRNLDTKLVGLRKHLKRAEMSSVGCVFGLFGGAAPDSERTTASRSQVIARTAKAATTSHIHHHFYNVQAVWRGQRTVRYTSHHTQRKLAYLDLIMLVPSEVGLIQPQFFLAFFS